MRYKGFDLIIERKDIGKVLTLDRDVLVYKKIRAVRKRDLLRVNAIAQLLIPKGSKIVVSKNYFAKSHENGKLRTNKAIVTAIIPRQENCSIHWSDNEQELYRFNSKHDHLFHYDFGKELNVRLNKTTETACRAGVHFFTTQLRAEKY